MANKSNQTEKELGIGRIVLIVLTVFIITPIFILGVIYYTNDNFKMEANKYLVNLPGSMGDYFSSFPTKPELDNQKVAIAKYFTEIDTSRASDKLILIKNEDEALYNEIIQMMVKLNPKKTNIIVEEVRKSLLKKDVLARTIEQIEAEKKAVVLDSAKYFESLSTITAVKEIESSLEAGEMTYQELASIFDNMKSEDSAHLLKYINEDMRNSIINNFKLDAKKREIKTLLNTMDDDDFKIKNAAEIYSTENPEELVNIIGNTDTYSIDELALIYKSIGIVKGAQVLAKLDNETFVHELVSSIKEEEILINDEDLITEDILKAYKVYRDFDNNVAQLTSVYEKMSDAQAADLIKRMIRNSGSPQNYHLSNGEVISISDEDLAFAILTKFSERKVASILTYLDTNLASEITKKLSLPNL